MKLDTNVVDGRVELAGKISRLKKLDLLIFILNLFVFFYTTIEMVYAVKTSEN